MKEKEKMDNMSFQFINKTSTNISNKKKSTYRLHELEKLLELLYSPILRLVVL